MIPKYFSIEHVYGHQDDAKEIYSIDTKEKLNIKADAIDTTYPLELVNLHLPSTVIAIYINKKYIHHNIDNVIRVVANVKET